MPEPMTFSVVTPSLNQGDWLRLCIASVADQGVKAQHIIQDAGSRDGTLDWLPTDPRVQAVVEPDQGMYDAVNRGLRKARGQILAYLNCDEQYLPGALAAVGAFFEQHPEVTVLFADAVVVDPAGHYLWHRKTLVPRRLHTALCPLSTLTCATFFRRSVVDQHQILFDPKWKIVGDSVWVMNLIRHRVPMAALGQFTSAFTHTGENLSLHTRGREETKAYYRQTPALLRGLRPIVLLHHRLRRWWGGVYRQAPFRFSLYTRNTPDQRVEQVAQHPTFRWRW